MASDVYLDIGKLEYLGFLSYWWQSGSTISEYALPTFSTFRGCAGYAGQAQKSVVSAEPTGVPKAHAEVPSKRPILARGIFR